MTDTPPSLFPEDSPPDESLSQQEGLARANLRALFQKDEADPPSDEVPLPPPAKPKGLFAEGPAQGKFRMGTLQQASLSDEVPAAPPPSIEAGPAPILTKAEPAPLAVDAPPHAETPPPPEEPPPPPVYHYRLAWAIPPEIEARINAARQHIGLGPLALGSLAFYPDFKAEAIEPIEAAITAWGAAHLPLKLTLERVEAVVIGSQRYLAAFALEPALTLNKAHQALSAALDPLANKLDDPEALAFAPRLPVSDQTPAAQFLRLLHQLQAEFAALEWELGALECLQVPEGEQNWEVRGRFGG